jgi:hypothetical protein
MMMPVNKSLTTPEPILDRYGRDIDRGHAVPGDSLKYFWDEKDDFKRWVGYEEWEKKNPEKAKTLNRMVADRDRAIRFHNEGIDEYLDEIITEELKGLNQ